jgi:hypothetical protein
VKTIKLWLRWLETHPWAIVVGLAGVLLTVLGWRRRGPTVGELNTRAAEKAGEAKAYKADADATGKKADAATAIVARDEAAISAARLEEIPAEHVKECSDDEVADIFSNSGL